MKKNWMIGLIGSLIIVLISTGTVFAAAPYASSVEERKNPPKNEQPTKEPKTTGNANSASHANKEKTKVVETVNYRGYIVSASDTTVTISLEDGSLVTFTVQAGTLPKIPTAGGEAVMSDLKVNYYVVIHGKLDTATQTLTATGINMVPGWTSKSVNGAGNVTDYQAGISITITDPNGVATTYLLTADTKIVSSDPTLTLGAGSTVVVIYTTDPATGTRTATSIVLTTPEALQTPVPTNTVEPTEAPEETKVP